MDDRLKRALEVANFNYTLYAEKKRLQAQLHRDLELAYNGGKFTIDRNFVVFLHLLNPDDDGSVTILDDNLNPIIVTDPEQFQKEVDNTYHRAVNRYRVEFESLKKKRSAKAIVDL
jgi:hypothetical protein